MAINYTSLLKLPKPDVNTPSWATYMHRLADVADLLAGKVATVTKTTGATTFADLDGTADKGKYPILRTSVTLTGNVQVTVPARDRLILAENLSSGAFSWKVQTSGGNGVNVPQGKRMWLRSTSTGVIAISRTDGRSTATEIGLAVITATHIASNAITTAKITDANVTLPKLAGGGSYGRIMYTATAAGFAWTTLARGTAGQVLAMSTAAVTKPVWKDNFIGKVATSTAMTFSAGTVKTFTHGLTGITNKYDYRSVQVMLICVNTDVGYSAGDVVFLGTEDGSSGQGIAIVADSTTAVKVVISNVGLSLHNKSSGAIGAVTSGDWHMRVRVGAQ